VARIHTGIAQRDHRKMWARCVEGFSRHAQSHERLHLVPHFERGSQPVYGFASAANAPIPEKWRRWIEAIFRKN
jgi:hypothetical protein